MTRVCLGVVCLVAVASSVGAQPRPGAFTTLVTTDPSITSICVGGNAPAAPSTCLGGLQAGPLVVNQAVTLPSFTPAVTTNRLYNVGGNLFFNGLALATGGSVGPGTPGMIPVFTGANSIADSVIGQAGSVVTVAATINSTVLGTSMFAAGGAGTEAVTIQNTAAGVANLGSLRVLSDTVTATFNTYSSTYTPTTLTPAASTLLFTDGAGGLSIAAFHATGSLRFYTGSGIIPRGTVTAAGLVQWTAFGAHSFVSSGVGTQTLSVGNTAAGAGNSSQIRALSDTVVSVFEATSSTFTTAGSAVQAATRVAGTGPGGISISAEHAAGDVRLYTNGTLRGTYNETGSYSFGGTAVTDSPAVPTIASGFGAGAAITGRDYAFLITAGTGTPTSGIVNVTGLGTAACVASSSAGTTPVLVSPLAASQVTLSRAAGFLAGETIAVLCRGF